MFRPIIRFTLTGIVLLYSLLVLGGCGGGGSGGFVTIQGDVSVPDAGTTVGRGRAALVGASIKAYRVSDLVAANFDLSAVTPLAEDADGTDSQGHFSMILTGSTIGKDIILIAQSGETRASRLIPDFEWQGTTAIVVDTATSLVAEEVLPIIKEDHLTQVLPQTVESLTERIRHELQQHPLNLETYQQMLPDQVGAGLQGETAVPFKEAVEEQRNNLGINDSSLARGFVQLVRDFGVAARDLSDDEVTEIHQSLDRQQALFENRIVEPTEGFIERVGFVLSAFRGLEGKAPARYRMNTDGTLERIGDAPDTKTWIVEETAGKVLTVTTLNAIATFGLNSTAGKFTVAVSSTTDSALDYDLILEVTKSDTETPTTPIQANVTLHFADQSLSAPIDFSGTIDTLVHRSRSAPTYSDMVFNGTLHSQFGDLTMDDVGVSWFTNSGDYKRLSRMTATKFELKTSYGDPVVFEVQGMDIAFLDQNVDQGYPHTSPFQYVASKLILKEGRLGERIELILNDANIQFIRAPKTPGQPELVLRQVTTKLTYHSPRVTLDGDVTGIWQNPKLGPLEGRPLANFPKGNLNFEGTLTPTLGRTAAVTLIINSNPTEAAPKFTAQVNLTYGAQSVEGSAEIELDVQGGNVQGIKTTRMVFTHHPTEFDFNLTLGGDGTGTGTITKPGGTKLADIGKASDLGLPDLGNVMIIKYTDNHFETLESVIP